MIDLSYVHLRLHTEFSVVDSTIKIPKLLDKVAEDSQPALGLTDYGNTFAYLKFYKAARKKGVKPLLGVDIGINNSNDSQRILLYCQNYNGYQKLCRLITKAWLVSSTKEGCIELSWLSEKDHLLGGKMSDNLICLSGGLEGELGKKIIRTNSISNKKIIKQDFQKYVDLFENRFYVEIQRAGFSNEEKYNEISLAIADDLKIPVVATHPIKFLHKQDYRAHIAKVCIAEGNTLANALKNTKFNENQYFCKQSEMKEKFRDLPEALENSLEIAKRCNLEFELNQVKLPNFSLERKISLDDYLFEQAENGLIYRLKKSDKSGKDIENNYEKYKKRLVSECKVIVSMGFSGYFLIVADFVNWAKKNDVPVGPGRGSGAGSLVAYSLGITDIDPIPFSLIFERFLNPERVSMPDFDIDFCQERRHLVIDYVRKKYGEKAVSQIVTFGTMASRAVIRDAGRVLEMPYTFCDQLSKLIPVIQNKPLTLEEAKKKEPLLLKREKEEEEVSTLLELARPLEDLVRNVGMHAGGVLIAPGELNEFCPLYKAPGTEGKESTVSMFDKDDIESLGLVKFDFLGLRNLTTLSMTVKEINKLFPKINLQLDDLNDFNDESTYKLLRKANTTAIFQLESEGMRKYLHKLQPDSFEDIIAMLALYRPGPLNSGMVDDFIKRKHGTQKIDYFHPDLKDCLSPTYGVIVYQEQVMQIAQIIADYSLGNADILRRAMGKKKPEEMAKQREIFLDGAKLKGYTNSLATRLFDLMEKFAEYGFNKSHTAAYAVITYQTAWLKCHYPAAFFAATMTSEKNDTDKIAQLVKDARANGMKVLEPNVNESNYKFTAVFEENKSQDILLDLSLIRFGLGAIKGVGELAVKNIVQEREKKQFTDFFDFCSRVDRRIVNKKTCEALIASGALDTLNKNHSLSRNEMFLNLESLLTFADQKEASKNQTSLFEDNISSDLTFKNKNFYHAWTPREKLIHEKEALGFCFSDHLFNLVKNEVANYHKSKIKNIKPNKDSYWIHGILTGVRKQISRRGPIYLLKIEDNESSTELSVFNETYELEKNKIKIDFYLAVLVKVESDEYSGGLRVIGHEFHNIVQARIRYLKEIEIVLSQSFLDETNLGRTIKTLKDLLNGNLEKDSTPIILKINTKDISCKIRPSEKWKINPNDKILDKIKSIFGNNSVQLNYKK